MLPFSMIPRRSTISPRAHTGNGANPLLSCDYFMTRGYPGVGVLPPFSVSSVHGACPGPVGALKSTRSFISLDRLDARHHPIAAVPPSPFVTILDAASSISPVFATLTENTGGGVYQSSTAN